MNVGGAREILWTLFYVPFRSDLVALLPSARCVPFGTSRPRSTTSSIIVHFVSSGLGFVMILLGTLGLGPFILSFH
jgi:hypothetical protein